MGVARQLEDCERLAERKGRVIVERFVDDDVSAWSGKRRPEYARCL
jgi:site-specific DNA recombinase